MNDILSSLFRLLGKKLNRMIQETQEHFCMFLVFNETIFKDISHPNEHKFELGNLLDGDL